MPTSLKNLCDAVLGESGFMIPATYFGGQPDDAQMAYLAIKAADALREEYPQALRKTHTITFTTATTYPLPSDFHEYMIDTARIAGRVDPVDLPASPEQWATLKATNSFGGPTIRIRIAEDSFRVLNPVVGEVLQLEYWSNKPWLDAGGAAVEMPTADSHSCIIDRALMVAAIKWRWKKEKGFPEWQADYADYQKTLAQFRSRDKGAKTIFFGEENQNPRSPYTNLWVS